VCVCVCVFCTGRSLPGLTLFFLVATSSSGQDGFVVVIAKKIILTDFLTVRARLGGPCDDRRFVADRQTDE
jgi:hypothetical protein